MSGVKDINVKAGNHFQIKVPYTGFPKPKAVWMNGNKEIEDDMRVHLKVAANHVTLTNTKAERGDSGRYRLTLKNPSGQDSGSLNVNVLVAPKVSPNFLPKDITVRRGEEFKIVIPFDGSPIPKAEWSVGGKPLSQDGRVSFENTPTEIQLFNKVAEKYDSGRYSVLLSSDKGMDSASINVNVVDSPSKPEGPLEVDSITPDSCILNWNAPKDDGGSPISNYVVEKMDLDTGKWEPVSKFVKGTNYEVMGLTEGHEFKFRVSAENQFGVGELLETSLSIVAQHPYTHSDPPGHPSVLDIDEVSVTLSWTKPRNDGGKKIIGYIVEYKDPTTGCWKEANEYPVAECVYQVKGLKKDKEYNFRIRAKNMAGLSESSGVIGPIIPKPTYTKASPPGVPEPVNSGKTYVDLKWEPPKHDGGTKITDYLVEKRLKGTEMWYKCNDYPCTDTSFTVANLPEDSEWEFRVMAVNAVGTSEPSLCSPAYKIKEKFESFAIEQDEESHQSFVNKSGSHDVVDIENGFNGESLSSDEADKYDDDDDKSYHPSGDESSSDEDTIDDLDLPSETLKSSMLKKQTAVVSDSDSEEDAEDGNDDASKVFPQLNSPKRKISFLEAKKTSSGNYDNKKHACLFCEKFLPNMSRHLTLVHYNEPQVAKVLLLPKKSRERRKLWEEIVNCGDYQHNYSVIDKGHGVIIPKYRKESSQSEMKDYIPCYLCKGMYRRSDLWKHTPQCIARSKVPNPKKQDHVKLGRLLFPPTCSNKHFQENVLNVMKDDDIKSVVLSDKRIIDFGSRMFDKHGKDEHKNVYISQKLREIGRLVKCTKNYSVNSVDELLITKNWNILVKCVREVAGYSEQTHTFTTPSLALKLGHSIQKCANFLKSEGLRENDDEKVKIADSFVSLYESDWTDTISSQALSSLNDKKYNKPLLLPLVEDVKKLNCYLDKEARKVRIEVKDNPPLYTELAQICLAQVILFNRRRSGEAERMTLSAYTEALVTGSGKPDDVVLSTLNEFEKTLCHSHLRVEIKGKRGRKVPVLFTEAMKESIDVLISMREKANVTQPFLFSRPGPLTKPYRGTDCIRRFSNEAGLENPNTISSTKLRKQLATLAQVLNLSETSQDILATFQGHNIRVHREFYRLPENALQVAKVSKLLHSINNGTIQQYRGMDFDEIDLPNKEKVDSESESEKSGEDEEVSDPASNDTGNGCSSSLCQTESSTVCKTNRKSKKDKVKFTPKGALTRHQWTREEKAALKKHFKGDITSGRTPRQLDCLNVIKKESCLKKFSWKQIKFAVKNLIATEKRQLKKLQCT